MTVNRGPLWASFWEETCPQRIGLTHAHWAKCPTEHTNPAHGIGQCCHCLAYADPAVHGSAVTPIELPPIELDDILPMALNEMLARLGLDPVTEDDVDTGDLLVPKRMTGVRFLAHPNDPQGQEFHPPGTRFMGHAHLIVEDWPHDMKQKAAQHIDRWHFRVPSKSDA